MSLGQIFFVILLAAIMVYISQRRNVLTDRIILLFLIFLGILFVIFPNITVRIANFFGIGRGTDLILYLFIFLCLFLFIYILSELNKLSTKFTEYIRMDALRNARDLTDHPNSSVIKEE
jgi:hypothetical protein